MTQKHKRIIKKSAKTRGRLDRLAKRPADPGHCAVTKPEFYKAYMSGYLGASC